MVDLHCHILPCVDDGAKSLQESLVMARIAVVDGITDIVATPHTHNGRYQNHLREVERGVRALQAVLDREGIPLRLHVGAEVHLHLEMIQHLEARSLPTLCNQGDYLLLELPATDIPKYADDLLYELKIRGITPIVAHPERHLIFSREIDRLAEWVQQGVLVQLTADSLLGGKGHHVKKAAKRMVKDGLVHVIASDAHGATRRRPVLQEAYLYLESHVSKSIAEQLQTNASRILHGMKIELEMNQVE